MWDALGNISTVGASIPVDILVYRDGDQIKIRISAITFLPFSANYVDVPPAQRERNLQTLDRLAEILNRFPSYRIGVQGHAVQIYWNDPIRGRTEQEQVLIPLSTARAEAIREALIARGVSAGRLTSSGVGAAQPLVPNSDLENRWINRRVEFTLER
jgi:outer membrane protein OmpA-like peptidoglycan-associated protein